MPKYLHLDIPEPCHEDWNKMTAEAQGRFCGSCQKTVTDFTNMSDAKLIAFFKNPKPSVCGRFNQEQLERDILIPRKRIPWVKYFFQFTLPAFLWSVKSSAQIGKVSITAPVQKMAVEKRSKLLGDTLIEKESCMPVNQLVGTLGGVSYSVDVTRNMSGKVTDFEGNPLIGANVFIKGINNAVAADTSGNFLLRNVRKGATVVATYVGFESKEVVVPNTGALLNIQLTPQLMGEIVVVAGSIRPTKKFKKEAAKEVCVKPADTTPSLSVYPNPVKSSMPLQLQWQNLEEGNYRLEVYNTSGMFMKFQKLVLEKGLKQTSLDLEELTPGNYFIRLVNEKTGKQVTEQFIVRE